VPATKGVDVRFAVSHHVIWGSACDGICPRNIFSIIEQLKSGLWTKGTMHHELVIAGLSLRYLAHARTARQKVIATIWEGSYHEISIRVPCASLDGPSSTL